MSAEVVSLFPKEVPPLMRLAVTAALLRYQFQLFDNGGESMRSPRSNLGEQALRLLTEQFPPATRGNLESAYRACDKDPIEFLRTVERTTPLHPSDLVYVRSGCQMTKLQLHIQQTAIDALETLLRQSGWQD